MISIPGFDAHRLRKRERTQGHWLSLGAWAGAVVADPGRLAARLVPRVLHVVVLDKHLVVPFRDGVLLAVVAPRRRIFAHIVACPLGKVPRSALMVGSRVNLLVLGLVEDVAHLGHFELAHLLFLAKDCLTLVLIKRSLNEALLNLWLFFHNGQAIALLSLGNRLDHLGHLEALLCRHIELLCHGYHRWA